MKLVIKIIWQNCYSSSEEGVIILGLGDKENCYMEELAFEESLRDWKEFLQRNKEGDFKWKAKHCKSIKLKKYKIHPYR